MRGKLSKEGKEELAFAIFLWKEFKNQGKLDIEIAKQAFKLAEYIEVAEQYLEICRKIIWPVKISIAE